MHIFLSRRSHFYSPISLFARNTHDRGLTTVPPQVDSPSQVVSFPDPLPPSIFAGERSWVWHSLVPRPTSALHFCGREKLGLAKLVPHSWFCRKYDVMCLSCGMADNAGEAYECLLCRSALNIASKRRVVHPRNPSNTYVHDFVRDSLCQGWQLPVDDHTRIYTCRTPCFSDLQKASNHKRALAGFIEKFLEQLRYKQIESTMDVSFSAVISTYLAPILTISLLSIIMKSRALTLETPMRPSGCCSRQPTSQDSDVSAVSTICVVHMMTVLMVISIFMIRTYLLAEIQAQLSTRVNCDHGVCQQQCTPLRTPSESMVNIVMCTYIGSARI